MSVQVLYCIKENFPVISNMQLPEHCSVRDRNSLPCSLPPSFVVSVISDEGEYMLAVVCDDHKKDVEEKISSLQAAGKIPQGRMHFEPVSVVTTDCIKGGYDDYVEVGLKRGILSADDSKSIV